ncbi:hypothetical protein SLA2020_453760 [Shorea laevis]
MPILSLLRSCSAHLAMTQLFYIQWGVPISCQDSCTRGVVYGGFYFSPLESRSRKGKHQVTEEDVMQKSDIKTIKANWDAAIDFQSQRMGVGAILRDATGGV